MKTNNIRLSQLQRINEKYDLNASLFKRGIISFERLLKWKELNSRVQQEIRKLDPSFGTPLPWQMEADTPLYNFNPEPYIRLMKEKWGTL